MHSYIQRYLNAVFSSIRKKGAIAPEGIGGMWSTFRQGRSSCLLGTTRIPLSDRPEPGTTPLVFSPRSSAKGRRNRRLVQNAQNRFTNQD